MISSSKKSKNSWRNININCKFYKFFESRKPKTLRYIIFIIRVSLKSVYNYCVYNTINIPILCNILINIM